MEITGITEITATTTITTIIDLRWRKGIVAESPLADAKRAGTGLSASR